jgi:hypothetical protein
VGTQEDYYVSAGDTSGYFEIARDGDGAFRSRTFYLNEARPDNVLPESRAPNAKYSRRMPKVGAADAIQAFVGSGDFMPCLD